MKVKIAEIKVVDRVRKNLGDLEELKKSILELGLLNPVTITPERVLLAGGRRLEACKQLGWEEIEVREIPIEDELQRLKAERDENVIRKDFSFSEIVEIGMKIEAVERERAKQRQLATQFGNTVMETCPLPRQEDTGKTRDKVAESLGLGSGKQYDKIKFIAAHADPEMIKQLDDGKLSVNKAYMQLKEKLKESERKINELQKELEQLRLRPVNNNLSEFNQLIEKQKQLKALKEQVKDTPQNKRQELEWDINDLEREVNELKAKMPRYVKELLQHELDEYQQKMELYEKKVLEARQKEAEVLAKLDHIEKENSKSHDAVTRLLVESEELKKQLKEQSEIIGKLQSIGINKDNIDKKLGDIQTIEDLIKKKERLTFECKDKEREYQRISEVKSVSERVSVTINKYLKNLPEVRGVLETELEQVKEDPYGMVFRTLKQYLPVAEKIYQILRSAYIRFDPEQIKEEATSQETDRVLKLIVPPQN